MCVCVRVCGTTEQAFPISESSPIYHQSSTLIGQANRIHNHTLLTNNTCCSAIDLIIIIIVKPVAASHTQTTLLHTTQMPP